MSFASMIEEKCATDPVFREGFRAVSIESGIRSRILDEILDNHKMTVKEFARTVPMREKLLSDFINEKRDLSIEWLHKIFWRLGWCLTVTLTPTKDCDYQEISKLRKGLYRKKPDGEDSASE